ncbi:hypothetical protein B0G69_8067 [Paraburkholderia sp. RAU2J]|uniref:hypothetical protein n=1 Tax=Paraburkholderia sp. RAU2J TaxID=1938810 RepID=UPI000EB20416|nr:hypothetical protein [Paraburkholderia sp. RAU2J]RKT10634.1 hypothetical protein B0G69_8067 [Paraburkholderia sp. RAU2J]
MNAAERLTACYTKFMALPFFTRRAVIFGASLSLWWFGALLSSKHVNNDLCVVLLLTGAAGVLWSSGLWRMWKVFAIIVAVCLAIMK